MEAPTETSDPLGWAAGGGRGRARGVLAIALALLLLPPTLGAQTPRPEDVSTLDGILAAYYDVISGPAGEAVDVERDRSLHHPDAWVAIIRVGPQGEKVVTRMTLDEYHGDNAPRAQPFYEIETDRVVQRSGDMVHVWSRYAYATEPGGEPYGGGVNSITLWWDGERFWIMGWMFDATAG